ncbi:MAG: YraN family protein [Gordonia sp. (in: high G+C Gram-positive bacteria)]|uniref:YraN family protein n=1 Tax=Gordonia sp. (in: high G+C Gram-positive bacteria) TaxID=84139 RepID=UPI0039E34758
MGENTLHGDRRRMVGRIGEDFADHHVRALGWTVLDRNWRTRYGELDLIAADGDTLIVVEVKTRMSRTYDDPVEAVDARKLQRMRLVTRQWLSARPPGARWYETIRFDVISVRLDVAHPEDRAAATLRHHRGLVD